MKNLSNIIIIMFSSLLVITSLALLYFYINIENNITGNSPFKENTRLELTNFSVKIPSTEHRLSLINHEITREVYRTMDDEDNYDIISGLIKIGNTESIEGILEVNSLFNKGFRIDSNLLEKEEKKNTSKPLDKYELSIYSMNRRQCIPNTKVKLIENCKIYRSFQVEEMKTLEDGKSFWTSSYKINVENRIKETGEKGDYIALILYNSNPYENKYDSSIMYIIDKETGIAKEIASSNNKISIKEEILIGGSRIDDKSIDVSETMSNYLNMKGLARYRYDKDITEDTVIKIYEHINRLGIIDGDCKSIKYNTKYDEKTVSRIVEAIVETNTKHKYRITYVN